MTRPAWTEYWIGIAHAVSARASCPRARVGAVLVSPDNRLLGCGYNGAPPGQPHCTDVGCEMVDGHCQRALHAEVNAVAFAARYGVPVAGAHLYLYVSRSDGGSTDVCRECAKVLTAAGVVW